MDDAIRKLLHGFRDFHNAYFAESRSLFDQLRKGQHPKVLVISCSDSRVDPALLTGCEPGDIFVIRNVANLVPPYEPGGSQHHGVSAALEYAIRNLKVHHVVVLGHSDCGGIKALMAPSHGSGKVDFIDVWLQLAASARDEVEHSMSEASFETRCRACEEAAILLSLENLMTFPWIAERVTAGELVLHGWYFHLHTGKLSAFDNDTGIMHLACALDCPSVTISALSASFTWFPYSSQKHRLCKAECAKVQCSKFCDRTNECIAKISVEQVWNAARKCLNEIDHGSLA